MSNVHHQRLAVVRVQVVCHESPVSLRIGLNQAVNILQEVFFGSRRTDQGREDLPGRHMQIAKQPERSVTPVFILAASERAGPGKEVASDPLESLDAGLFVNGNGVNAAGAMQFNGFAIDGTDFDDLSLPSLLIVDLWKQPMLIAMRLYIGSILKKRSRDCVRYSGRCFLQTRFA